MEETIRKLTTALVATAAILAAGSIAGAAPITGAGSPLPLTNTYSPIENIACWCGPYRCGCARPYYRPYRYGYGYGYGYGYRPYRYRY